MLPLVSGGRGGKGDRVFSAALLCAAFFLCLLTIPLACSFGPLQLPFKDVLRVLAFRFADAQDWTGTAFLGSQGLSRLLDADTLRLIVLDLRLPRVLLALGAGAGLAVAGTVFQGILRNPLADPFTLGVSGGAAFGAALAISLGLSGAALGFGIPLASFAGAALALGAVLMLGRIGGGLRHETLILAGVVVSSLLAALIALVKALDEASVTGIVFWIMGSFQGRGWTELLLLLPGLACGSFLALALHSRLDMLSLGDRTARHLGLNASRLRLVLLLAAGAITASCVAVSGIIGFIGLIVPHLCRMLLGAAHRQLLPASALCGALLLAWSDVAARTILPGGVELPVGVVTALLGGPFFCYILGKKQGLSSAGKRAPGPPADAVPQESGRSSVPEADTGEPRRAPGTPPVLRAFSQCPGRGASLEAEKELECRDLWFGYGKKRIPPAPRQETGASDAHNEAGASAVLAGVSFSLRKGEFVGLLGPNASGKSTLLHCLSGILKPWRGELLLHGHALGKLKEKERARLLAHLPQKPESIPAMSVFHLALMGRHAHTPFLGGYSAEDRRKTLSALKETGVLHLQGHTADTLSGGELQRVLLARALAQEAPLLFLDEATAGLDPAFQIAVLDALHRKNREQGLTVLAAMHDLNLAAMYCSRLIFLKQGRILADGPVREVFTPEILRRVYASEISLVAHPDNGLPQAVLRPDI